MYIMYLGRNFISLLLRLQFFIFGFLGTHVCVTFISALDGLVITLLVKT